MSKTLSKHPRVDEVEPDTATAVDMAEALIRYADDVKKNEFTKSTLRDTHLPLESPHPKREQP